MQTVAYKVGRDISELHSRISSSRTKAEILGEQLEALERTHGVMDDVIAGKSSTGVQSSTTEQSSTANVISLGKIARDLHQVAPDLANEALINMDSDAVDEHGHASIIQMQLIQESNNNWDPLFPEGEHMWGFAASRLTPSPESATSRPAQQKIKQYFNLRRWPVWAQEEKVQTAVKSSGLVIQEKPKDPTPTSQAQDNVMGDIMAEMPRERYTGRGGPPMFPFGETPYQQAFISWRMQQDLADGEHHTLFELVQY